MLLWSGCNYLQWMPQNMYLIQALPFIYKRALKNPLLNSVNKNSIITLTIWFDSFSLWWPALQGNQGKTVELPDGIGSLAQTFIAVRGA